MTRLATATAIIATSAIISTGMAMASEQSINVEQIPFGNDVGEKEQAYIDSINEEIKKEILKEKEKMSKKNKKSISNRVTGKNTDR